MFFVDFVVFINSFMICLNGYSFEDLLCGLISREYSRSLIWRKFRKIKLGQLSFSLRFALAFLMSFSFIFMRNEDVSMKTTWKMQCLACFTFCDLAHSLTSLKLQVTSNLFHKQFCFQAISNIFIRPLKMTRKCPFCFQYSVLMERAKNFQRAPEQSLIDHYLQSENHRFSIDFWLSALIWLTKSALKYHFSHLCS